MTTLTYDARGALQRLTLPSICRELLLRQRTLALFGFALLALVLPTALAWALDDRLLRGANVWTKPLKFELSIGLFALTTAWFIGQLKPAARGGRWVRGLVVVLVGAGSFELAYIALQAGLGQGSHYQVSDPLHAVMYSLMGVGALLLTATQLLLAWRLMVDGLPMPAARRAGLLWGLALTFMLGAGVGGLLSGIQPPDGAGLPLFGWTLQQGDLRPAHFVGIHAQQLLPLAGWVAARRGWSTARVHGLAIAYGLLCIGLVAWALR